jgi:hypothetical protein
MKKPEVTRITYQRFRYSVYSHFEDFFGASQSPIDYWSLLNGGAHIWRGMFAWT